LLGCPPPPTPRDRDSRDLLRHGAYVGTFQARGAPRAYPPIPRRAGRPTEPRRRLRLLIPLHHQQANPPSARCPDQTHRRTDPTAAARPPVAPHASGARSSTCRPAVVTAHGPARRLTSPLPSPAVRSRPLLLFPTPTSSSPPPTDRLPIHPSVCLSACLHAQTRGTRSSSSLLP
jgi:hypothetical protein